MPACAKGSEMKEFVLFVFMLSGMDVERFETLEICRFAAKQYAIVYCDGAVYSETKGDIAWFKCGWDEVAKDKNGNIQRFADGTPMKKHEYIWSWVGSGLRLRQFRAGCISK